MSSSSSRRSRKAASLSHVYYTNAVYFPNHRIYTGESPGVLNYSCVNTVFYCFASIASDGGVYLSDEYADLRAPCDGVSGGLGSLMHLKQKHPHLQVILSIGGSQSSAIFPIVAGSAVLRDNFARSARGLVEASGLDGIDIVWQYPTDSLQGANFLALLAATRLYLPEEQYLLTAALPASRSVLGNIDLRRAADYIDLLNLMPTHSHHHAPLHYSSSSSSSHGSGSSGRDDESSGAGCVSLLLSQGVPARKILLGTPTAGHRGSPKSKGKSSSSSSRAGSEDSDSVKLKAAFVRQKGLGGLFYWAGATDSKDGKRSLVSTGFRALHSS